MEKREKMTGLGFWNIRVFGTARPYNDNQQEISLFDVKELYDAAYDPKLRAQGRFEEFHRLLAEAEALDDAYRMQEGLKAIEKRNTAAAA